jgi:single-strand DNA-binding protein
MQPEERQLPSGDLIVSTRVVVDREPPRGKSARTRSRQRVDAIDCVAWSARAQRAIRRWSQGDQVSVEGAIRRRFFRSEKGLVSRVEVEIVQAKLVASASRTAAKQPSPTEEPGD